MDAEPTYIIVRMSLKYKLLLAILGALLPPTLIVLLAWPNLGPTLWIAAGLAGVAALFLMLLFLEIVRVIADTLLPR
ncbi:MAG TPA: hypothetical protein VMG08_01825 [Allosphingosinicella sp.]|nr:hypothetical protein [Allosphingosinicella sp.]